MKRRTVTFEDENIYLFNQIKGSFLWKKNKDLDFTKLSNMVLAIGFNHLINGQISDKELDIMTDYIFKFKIKKYQNEFNIEKWIDDLHPILLNQLQIKCCKTNPLTVLNEGKQ